MPVRSRLRFSHDIGVQATALCNSIILFWLFFATAGPQDETRESRLTTSVEHRSDLWIHKIYQVNACRVERRVTSFTHDWIQRQRTRTSDAATYRYSDKDTWCRLGERLRLQRQRPSCPMPSLMACVKRNVRPMRHGVGKEFSTRVGSIV